MGKSELLQKYINKRLKCETWTRVMGYMRNINSFNIGKKSEFQQRVFFDIKHLNSK